MSVSLSGILEEAGQVKGARDQIGDALTFYIDQYNQLARRLDGRDIVNGFHLELDEMLNQKRTRDALAKDITCKKGCAYCCYLQIDISKDEAALIRAFCEDEGISLRKNRLQSQAQAKGREAWAKLTPEQKRCVFLDEFNECLIYDHRPASCRKYLVVSDPELCDAETIRKVPIFVNWHVEVIASAILNGSQGGPLAEMLLDVMEVEK